MRRSTNRLIGLGVSGGAALGLLVIGLTMHATDTVGTARIGRPVTVPLDVERDGADTDVEVQVTIDGHGPYWFALDTGASTSAVSAVLAKRLHLADTGASTEFDSANGSSTAELVRVRTWSAGPLPLQRGAVVSELKGLDGDGLLGSDQLSRFGTVAIDYRAETLRVSPLR